MVELTEMFLDERSFSQALMANSDFSGKKSDKGKGKKSSSSSEIIFSLIQTTRASLELLLLMMLKLFIEEKKIKNSLINMKNDLTGMKKHLHHLNLQDLHHQVLKTTVLFHDLKKRKVN